MPLVRYAYAAPLTTTGDVVGGVAPGCGGEDEGGEELGVTPGGVGEDKGGGIVLGGGGVGGGGVDAVSDAQTVKPLSVTEPSAYQRISSPRSKRTERGPRSRPLYETPLSVT